MKRKCKINKRMNEWIKMNRKTYSLISDQLLCFVNGGSLFLKKQRQSEDQFKIWLIWQCENTHTMREREREAWI